MALLRYAGMWARRPRTAAGLAALLSDYFEIPVEVEQFHGQWLQLDPSDQSQLSSTCTNCRLGVNLVIGERVWDVEGKIRIRVGPLSYEQFVEFLPYRGATSRSKAFFLLSHLTRLYIGPTLAFDVQLLLRGESVPDSILSDPKAPGLRLGWNTWLRSGKLQGCVKDAVFEGQEVFDLTGSRQDLMLRRPGVFPAGDRSLPPGSPCGSVSPRKASVKAAKKTSRTSRLRGDYPSAKNGTLNGE